MIISSEMPTISPPVTYQQWLDCFQLMREQPLSSVGIYEAAAAGTFTGTRAIQAALERQMVDTINAVLNRSEKRFLRELNECLSFHELERAEFLFKRLKKDVHQTLFFMQLSFLSDGFKEKLYSSIKTQLDCFWNDTIASLRKRAMDHPNSALEDTIFLIRRIRLFS